MVIGNKDMFGKTANLNRKNEKGAALAMAIIVLAILSVVALTALAFSSTEARIAAVIFSVLRLFTPERLRWRK